MTLFFVYTFVASSRVRACVRACVHVCDSNHCCKVTSASLVVYHSLRSVTAAQGLDGVLVRPPCPPLL